MRLFWYAWPGHYDSSINRDRLVIAKESQRENRQKWWIYMQKKDTVPFQGSSPPLSVMEGKYQQVNITSPYQSYLPKTVSSSVLLKDSQLVDQSIFPVRPESRVLISLVVVKSVFKRTVLHEHVNGSDSECERGKSRARNNCSIFAHLMNSPTWIV